jgi:nucleoid DNA-binding protein
MAKLSIQELAAVLVEKKGLEKGEAQRFVAAIFDVIQAGVEKDKLVKVKGLGTFKVIDVDARESVNVNTGDRVLIDSHSKITFTPDTTMKELVNKPFSGFETVALNEGVEFDDMPIVESDKEEDTEAETEVMKETVVSQKVVPTAKVGKKTIAKEPAVEEPASAAVDTQMVEFYEEAPDDNEETSSRWWIWLLILILGLCIGFASGLYVGEKGGISYASLCSRQQKETVIDSLQETAMPTVVSQDTIAADMLAADTLKKESLQEVSVKQQETIKPKEAEPEYKKYEEMDSRVRTGAYYIAGLDQVVEAREGDTVERVSRRYLGEGMSCYVEVYNGLSGKTVLQAGQKVKIPQLKLKKYLK